MVPEGAVLWLLFILPPKIFDFSSFSIYTSFLIPPLLGFYAKLFVINSLSTTNLTITFIAIFCSVISCVRYLNLIQITNKKMENIVTLMHKGSSLNIQFNSTLSYIIALLTLLITISFINPIYLIST